MYRKELTRLCHRAYRQYKYLYRKMIQEETIRKAWRNLRKGKTKRKAVIAIEKNLDAEVKKMQVMIINTKPEGYIVEHPELAYEPPKIRKKKVVNERGKKRIAHLAEIREQWYFHVIVEVLKPIVMKRMYKYSCGSIPGRGPHTGKAKLERVIRRGKGIRYYFKFDIRHFYDNLRIKVVIRELRKDIADELFLYCIEKIYKYVKKGVMIGLFISPWLANYVLCDLDWMIINADGVTAFVRYMDDVTLFAAAKKALHRIIPSVRQELGRLRLRLKRNYQVCRFDYPTGKTRRTCGGKEVEIRKGRPLDFMGFLFFREKTLIRKSIMLHATRTARKLYRAKEAGRRYYAKSVRAMVSHMGWFLHTDSYNCYEVEIKPYVNIGKLKKIISKLDKEASKNERMEKGVLFGTTA